MRSECNWKFYQHPHAADSCASTGFPLWTIGRIWCQSPDGITVSNGAGSSSGLGISALMMLSSSLTITMKNAGDEAIVDVLDHYFECYQNANLVEPCCSNVHAHAPVLLSRHHIRKLFFGMWQSKWDLNITNVHSTRKWQRKEIEQEQESKGNGGCHCCCSGHFIRYFAELWGNHISHSGEESTCHHFFIYDNFYTGLSPHQPCVSSGFVFTSAWPSLSSRFFGH